MNQSKYDVIYILDPNTSTEDMAAVAAKVEQIVAETKATILKKDDWGKRRLAYLVKKHREGHYVFYHLQAPPETVAELNRNFRLLERVIKFMIAKDTISHLKAKVKPPRVKTSTEGTGTRPYSSNSRTSHSSHRPTAPSHSGPSAPSTTSAPTAPAPTAAPAEAPAPTAPPAV
jgi:small subunit ribosomal protein S6